MGKRVQDQIPIAIQRNMSQGMGQVGTKPGTRTSDQLGIEIISTMSQHTCEQVANVSKGQGEPNLTCQLDSNMGTEEERKRRRAQTLKAVPWMRTKSCHNSETRKRSHRSKKSTNLEVRIHEGVQVVNNYSFG